MAIVASAGLAALASAVPASATDCVQRLSFVSASNLPIEPIVAQANTATLKYTIAPALVASNETGVAPVAIIVAIKTGTIDGGKKLGPVARGTDEHLLGTKNGGGTGGLDGGTVLKTAEGWSGLTVEGTGLDIAGSGPKFSARSLV
jgi:hypothetical protein